MKIKIKEANKDNFEELILLRLLLLKNSSKLNPSSSYSIEKIQKSTNYMKNYLKKDDNKYFIAYHNLLPIGYLHVTYDDKKNKKRSYLSELYILDLYRNKGVGKKLVFSQLKFLKKLGITENTLTTTKNKNKKIINFYKKLKYNLIKESKKKNIIYFSKDI